MDKDEELEALKQKLDNKDISKEDYELERADIVDRAQKLDELKQRLDNKEIDGKTYNRLSYEIINRSKNEETEIENIENKNSFTGSRIRVHFKAIAIITIILIAVFGTIGIFEGIRASKIAEHTITGVNKKNLPNPIQGTTRGEINVNIDGTNIKIEKLAAYTIYGKVVATHDYTLKKTLYEKLSPVDFTIVYGEGIELAENLNFSTNSDRAVFYKPKNGDWSWYNENADLIRAKTTNNHLIHADEKIKDLLLQVRVGDYVKIKGYLVGVYSDQYQPWVSSLSRDDHYHFPLNPSADEDSGACEIIYVTEINWIE